MTPLSEARLRELRDNQFYDIPTLSERRAILDELLAAREAKAALPADHRLREAAKEALQLIDFIAAYNKGDQDDEDDRTMARVANELRAALDAAPAVAEPVTGHVERHRELCAEEWPPFGDKERPGEPSRKDATKWLQWFCGMVRHYAWFVPPGDAQFAGETATYGITNKAAPAVAEPASPSAEEVDAAIKALERAAFQHGAERQARSMLFGVEVDTLTPVETARTKLRSMCLRGGKPEKQP